MEIANESMAFPKHKCQAFVTNKLPVPNQRGVKWTLQMSQISVMIPIGIRLHLKAAKKGNSLVHYECKNDSTVCNMNSKMGPQFSL